MNTKKRIHILLCLLILATSIFNGYSLTVHADSTVSLPNKNDWRYKTYAPYSQTKSYKIWYQTSQSVSKVIYNNKRAKKFVKGKLISFTGDIATLGGPVVTKFGTAAASSAMSYVGVALVGTKYTVISIANRDIKYLNSVAKDKLKKDLKCVTRVKFKWTNPKKFKYKVVIESYITYKGARLSGTTHSTTTTGVM